MSKPLFIDETGIPVYCLNDLCSAVIDCPHSSPEWKDNGVRVVRNFNIQDGRLDFSDGYYVSEECYNERIRRGTPEPGDIIISREAPMGAAAIVPDGLKCCLGQRLVLLKVNRAICDPKYLLFALNSDYVQTQMRRADATGSTVSNLAIPDLKEIKVPLIRSQHELADCLSKLNSAIELNNQVNDNLHQMIQAIYLHMFFDRKPNARLGDLLIEHPKSTVQVNDAKGFEGAYPFFTSGEAILRWNKPMTTDSICLLNTGGNADVKFYAGAAAYSTDTWCISATNGLTEYLYMLLQTIRKELDIKFFTGTGLKHLQKPLLKERPVYQPTSKEAARFNQIAVPAMALISENIRQNCELQTLRNWLLPMLMNGQATVEATQPNYRLSRD